MATAQVTYSFAPQTLIEAHEANTNFSDLVQFLNLQVMHRDASAAFSNVPSGPAGQNPTNADHLVRKGYVDMPVLDATSSGSVSNSTGPTNLGGWSASISKDISITSSGRITFNRSGRYIVGIRGRYAEGSTFLYAFGLTLSGSVIVADMVQGSGADGISSWNGMQLSCSTIRHFSAGNEIRAVYGQASGGGKAYSARVWAMGVPGTLS
jgi:hypothetical protein